MMNQLFPENSNEFEEIPIKDGILRFYPFLFSPKESEVFFTQLKENVKWKQEEIRIHGKIIPIPRLTAWFGDAGKTYMYSGITVEPEPWTPTLLEIKRKIEEVSNVTFNSVLLNYYRNERDSVSWHSDDESELNKNPIIGSVSFGDVRTFQLKHKTDKTLKLNKDLPDGSYLEMSGSTQHHWLHQIPKRTRKIGPRINLTFRIIWRNNERNIECKK
ncbi:alpha-ketoglutarate-dependent dioxygenase AlkB [Candidatus Poribacteria bacterium]|nr:alpha-ketoglutarate-dependent dioxygenase AlkB [Candidatus Poribacteria bacterium]